MTTRRRMLQSLSVSAALASVAAHSSGGETGGVKPVAGRDPIDDPGQDWSAFRLVASGPLPEPLAYGVGYNWFDHLGSGGTYARYDRYPLDAQIYPDLADQAAWREIRTALDEMRPGFIRFGLPPDPHVGPDGRLVTGTVHLKRLAVARRLGARERLHDPARHVPDPARARVPGAEDGRHVQLQHGRRRQRGLRRALRRAVAAARREGPRPRQRAPVQPRQRADGVRRLPDAGRRPRRLPALRRHVPADARRARPRRRSARAAGPRRAATPTPTGRSSCPSRWRAASTSTRSWTPTRSTSTACASTTCRRARARRRGRSAT